MGSATEHTLQQQHGVTDRLLLTCMRRTATPTELSSSVRKAAPRLAGPAGAASPRSLPCAGLAELSLKEAHTSQATNSSSVRTPMVCPCWLTPGVADSDVAVAVPVRAASLAFAAAGVTT